MNAHKWRDYLEEQLREHGKRIFTLSELANVRGASRESLNVELSRLLERRILVRYAHGIYGLPGAVYPEALLPEIDSSAYITGLHALFVHGLVTQVPTAISCFTRRRSSRSRVRETAAGRFVFSSIRSRVYELPPEGVLAGPEQALSDFVYSCRRDGVDARSQVTFQNLSRLVPGRLRATLGRYPEAVRRDVYRLIEGEGKEGRKETRRSRPAASPREVRDPACLANDGQGQ